MKKLNLNMTIDEFENGYWYAEQLKVFAKEIGILHTEKLRKDELEKQIKSFLKTKKINQSTPKQLSSTLSKIKDIDRKLTRKTLVINYTSNKITKEFIQKEVNKIDPNLKKKSGDSYWLNRWREEQLEKGKKITYGDLIDYLLKLRRNKERLPQIPSTKFNNFITDYLADNSGASKNEAVQEWYKLKEIDIPKNYKSYVSFLKNIGNVKVKKKK